MNRIFAIARLGLVAAALVVVTAAPLAAQLGPIDPRFDVREAGDVRLIRDTGSGAFYIQLFPKQPWIDGPPLDPYSAYVSVAVEYGDEKFSLLWEEVDGSPTVDAAGGSGVLAWTGYILKSGSVVIWLPVTPQPGEQFRVDVETGVAATSSDPGAGSTWMALTAPENAEPVDLLFGPDYPVWNLAANEAMAPPVTTTLQTTTTVPETTTTVQETTSTPAPTALATDTIAPANAPATREAGGSSTPTAAVVAGVALVAAGGIGVWTLARRRSARALVTEPPGDTSVLLMPGDISDTSRSTRPVGGEEADDLLPNSEPTGIYVPTDEDARRIDREIDEEANRLGRELDEDMERRIDQIDGHPASDADDPLPNSEPTGIYVSTDEDARRIDREIDEEANRLGRELDEDMERRIDLIDGHPAPDADDLLPNFKPTGIYVPTDELEEQMEYERLAEESIRYELEHPHAHPHSTSDGVPGRANADGIPDGDRSEDDTGDPDDPRSGDGMDNSDGIEYPDDTAPEKPSSDKTDPETPPDGFVDIDL